MSLRSAPMSKAVSKAVAMRRARWTAAASVLAIQFDAAKADSKHR